MVQLKPLTALLFSLCLLLPWISAKSTDVHYCNKKANYDVKVSGVEITPFPISRGKETTFSIAASSDRAFSGGKLTIDVSYFGFHVHGETHDLCAKTACPVSVGDFVISHSQSLPGITPPGSYTLKMSMVDENKKQLTCITFYFSIGLTASETLASS
ncbi:putative phosphatidylglycerol/phosphatidylinositol transfer protein DDB_G0282179 [Olea europaea var. sylvestris]|uniref:MD-2-related lipid-recognition domain-containing protein n=1 Tax=Olea europaea subsp. europaea TaxID=158383 RepID=A0A8S0P990_OLEEU|nr:putative phosphatidylglycerol/phosphatidylinositol transfer protein DDB_G0282179 [Olea europaea var. sylvestris]CAA2934911.1 Hypothetical predicted protein [Olea europaea subsp. europaea]